MFPLKSTIEYYSVKCFAGFSGGWLGAQLIARAVRIESCWECTILLRRGAPKLLALMAALHVIDASIKVTGRRIQVG